MKMLDTIDYKNAANICINCDHIIAVEESILADPATRMPLAKIYTTQAKGGYYLVKTPYLEVLGFLKS